MSPDGWLPDRISIGVLTRAFPPELVDEVIEVTGTREQRRRLLPARLMVYFVLALWLFRGRNCGYGQVMAKLADCWRGPRECRAGPARRMMASGAGDLHAISARSPPVLYTWLLVYAVATTTSMGRERWCVPSRYSRLRFSQSPL